MNSESSKPEITLRDHFAALAMNMLLQISPETGVGNCDINSIGKWSYLIADKMLLAREGKQ